MTGMTVINGTAIRKPSSGKTTPMTRPDRQGKKAVQAFLTVEKWKTLRHLVTDTERTANDLLDEAITLLAEKYREEPRQSKTRNTTRALRHG